MPNPEITTRKNYKILDTTPTGAGGQALNDNFTRIGDDIERIDANLDVLNAVGVSGASGVSGFSGTSGASGASGKQSCAEVYTIQFTGVSGIGIVPFTQTSETEWIGDPSGSITFSNGIWVLTIVSNNAHTDTYYCALPCPSSTVDGWIQLTNTTGGYIASVTNSYVGTSGASGVSGAIGSAGINGANGTSGVSGTSGLSGTSGRSGVSGTSGLSGTSGTHGCADSYTFNVDGFEWGAVPFTMPRYLGGWYLLSGGIQATLAKSGTTWQLSIYDITNEWSATYSTTAANGCPSTNIANWSLLGENGTSTTLISVTNSNVGTSGVSGTSGHSGVSGANGSAGASGASGTSGLSGTSGKSGLSGTSGLRPCCNSYNVTVAGAGGSDGLYTVTLDSPNHWTDGTATLSLTGSLWFFVVNADDWGANALILGCPPKTTTGNADTGWVALDSTGTITLDNCYDGAAGVSGLSGTSGRSGVSGTSGLSGTSGVSGIGVSGTSGTSGVSGISGTSGVTGNTIDEIKLSLDAGGSVISTGLLGTTQITTNCTILNWTLTSDATGSIVVDLKSSTYANWPTTTSICNANKPTLSSAQKNTAATSGWTTITAGDMLDIVVDSATTITKAFLTLKIQR